MFKSMKSGLEKTRKSLVKNLDEMVFGERIISQETFDELEEILITGDVGAQFTYELIEEVKNRASRKELDDSSTLRRLLIEKMTETLLKSEVPLDVSPDMRPFSILVVGVNGTGKTTTIGKIASRFSKDHSPVMMVAADTFRAAAVEQLEVWSNRTGAHLVKHDMGSDPAAVVYDAVHEARIVKPKTMIIDTAGRLHTKTNLMDELKKIKRVMQKELPGSPHETLLVLDATTGQNALTQAKLFNQEIGVTGLVLTKLDGTAKGGILMRIAEETGLPIRFVGIGEGKDDLRPFRSEEFLNALFSKEE